MGDINTQQILNECKEYARTGYRISSEQEKNLRKTLDSAREKIRGAVLDFASSSYYAPEAMEQLQIQLNDIERSYDNLYFALQEDLEKRKQNMSKFSITLFGRTKAGKSTLMEILKKGDGSSIGKGAQRTTRDVRTYSWKGLEITDVPGVAAFEGEDDEQIAFEAAKNADVILFLFTDDAPQQAEADCFSKIIDMGKPVICVMNVKMAMREHDDLNDTRKDIEKKFDMERLERIRNQFLQFADQFGQTWNHIPFVYVHLRAAFLSQHTEDHAKRDAFYEISRMDQLEWKILEVVRAQGKFFRIKTFVDSISVPMLNSIEELLGQSAVNGLQGRTILAKKRELSRWEKQYRKEGHNRISTHISKIQSDLYDAAAAFAEDHFDDKEVNKAWQKLLDSYRVEDRCQELMDELAQQSVDRISEIAREIEKELEYITHISGERLFKRRKIFDGKKALGWAGIVADGVLAVAGGIAVLVGESAMAATLGTAALVFGVAVGLGGLFLKGRGEKEQEARAKLETQLRKNVDNICSSYQSKMEEKLEEIIKNQSAAMIREMQRIMSVVFKLADTQRALAWDLNYHLMDLNRSLFEEALGMTNMESLQPYICKVARVPGTICMIVVRNDTVFPDGWEKTLGSLMSEQIWNIYDTNNKKLLISRTLSNSCDLNKIDVEKKIGVAHVPYDSNDNKIRTRVRLAQQFTELLILNQ